MKAIEESKRCKRGNFNWLLMRIADIPKLPQGFPISFPETIVWEDGAPKFAVILSSNRLIKQPAKSLKQYLDDYFKKTKKGSILLVYSEKNVYKRLAISRRELQKLHSVQKSNTEIKYKVMLRLKPPENRGICIVGEKLMREIVTQWPKSSLKRIEAFHRYIDDYSTNSAVIRVRYKQKDCVEVISLAKRCADALNVLVGLLKAHSGVVVVEMKAEFLASGSSYLLHNAWDIVYKNSVKNIDNKESEEAASERWKEQLKFSLTRRLARNIDERKNNFIESLRGIINNHVQQIKQEVGLVTKPRGGIMSRKSEEIFKRLHPRSWVDLLQRISLGKRSVTVAEYQLTIPKERRLLSRNTCELSHNCRKVKAMNKSCDKKSKELYGIAQNLHEDSIAKKSSSRVDVRMNASTLQMWRSKSINLAELKPTAKFIS